MVEPPRRGTGRRPAASRALRHVVRQTYGVYPSLELRNRLCSVRARRRWTAFEDHEVARLRASVDFPSAQVVTVISTFQRAELLQRAVDSALRQTVKDHVVVVVDDGGGQLPELSDPRVTAVTLSRNTRVPGVVRNVGIRLSTSAYLAFLDDDNEWRPDHLAGALERLTRDPDCRMVLSAATRRYRDGRVHDVLVPAASRRRMRNDGMSADVNGVVVRRGPDVLFSRMPRTASTFPKEDWEFVYRLSRNAGVAVNPQPTVQYLINMDSYYTPWFT